MVTEIVQLDVTVERVRREPNGAALAAFLGAGVGAFAMGVFVILNEAGLFAPPSVYQPAGGVSGRTTLTIIVWLVAWGVLHFQWRGRELPSGRVVGLIFLLIGLSIVATFPPVWGLL